MILKIAIAVASALVTPPSAASDCQEKAELHWAIADSIGDNADAAYEDTIYLCGKDGK